MLSFLRQPFIWDWTRVTKMKKHIQKDSFRRTIMGRNESNRLTLKTIQTNWTLPLVNRLFATIQLSQSTGSVVKIRNRCVSSGRSRGTLKHSKLSRSKIREFVAKNLLLGLKKDSW